MSETIAIGLIAKALIEAAATACLIIENLGGKTSTKMKEENDPVTEVDHTVQHSIVTKILKSFPGIKIVGEEKLDEHMILEKEN